MHSTTSVRAAFAVTAAAVALLLSGCVAPGPTAPTGTPDTTASPSATTTPPPTTPAPSPTESVPEPTKTPEPDTDPSPTAAPGPGVTVELLNTSYDPVTRSVTAAGMVTDRVSNAGTCTLDVSQGDVHLAASASGEAGPSMTYCSGLSVVLPDGAAGTWTATISYAEEGFSGETTGDVTIS